MPEVVQTEYLRRLFDVLEEQGRSKSWFARKVGVNRSHLYQIHHGERPLTQKFRERSALVLQLPDDWLFFLPDEGRERPNKGRYSTNELHVSDDH